MGKSEAEYERLTYRLTIDAAKLLAEKNATRHAKFCYVFRRGERIDRESAGHVGTVKGQDRETPCFACRFAARYSVPAGLSASD
ncbi:hypothetical protein ACFSKT_00040 [Paenibacillus xanthanilyticus]|uniref:hypothetical protein n=1 Tax=Paenibacillus xanthanilyticus TaxID=1783531 RepID=UPI0036417574